MFYAPRRIAFATCADAFEGTLSSAPAVGSPVPFERRLGIYHVDEWASDERGGVYFRTRQRPDLLGSEVTTYGFVYQPNRRGSPFGDGDYAIRRLSGDWYWFRASDDWF